MTHPSDDAGRQRAGQGSVYRGVRLAENERQLRRIDEGRSAKRVEQLSVREGHVLSVAEWGCVTLVVAWRDLETMVTGIASAVVSESARASLERLA